MKAMLKKRNTRILFGCFLILTLVFLYGELIYPHSPQIPTGASLEAPSWKHWLGTDNLGIDIYAQISRGFFTSMFMCMNIHAPFFFIFHIVDSFL